MSVYDKLTKKYLKNISDIKKRDFLNYLRQFYEDNINPSIDNIKSLIDDFILNESMLEKTNDMLDKNTTKFIDESKQKRRFNILLIGPTGSGKSTLINEFLKLKEKKAKEGVGDVQTWEFQEYFTEDSKYCLIDSQGFDYSKPVEEFSKVLQSQIKEYNKLTYKFIDMIYYCTNNMNRFQIQEYQLIKELKKIFNLERVPLIIVLTQCYFQEDYIKMKNFIEDKYKEERFTCVRLVAKRKEYIPAIGLEELKAETDKRINNFQENAYAGRFIANISQILYSDYKYSFIKSFIKGFFYQNKDESIHSLFKKIFNMYRFGKGDLPESYNERIETIKKSFLNAYETNLNQLTDIIIDLHAESSLIDELNLNKNNDLSEDNINEKNEKIKYLKNEEFESFKNDIDSIVFPCCLDILKIEIIKSFNGHIFNSLQPKIEKLMAKVD
jgi:GTP-binding protein EngB required for normal cell division